MYLEVLACVDPKLGAHITAMHVAKKATLWVVEDALLSNQPVTTRTRTSPQSEGCTMFTLAVVVILK